MVCRFDTTLFEIRYPYPPGQYRTPQQGMQFLGLRVEQCFDKTADRLNEYGEPTYTTYTGDWVAVAPDGTEAAGGGSSWNDWPAPKFPENVTMNPGDCLKGW